jgi:phosphoadenosine phosphosulfate reductase
LDQGYKSVGDWHSTQKSGEGEAGERAGRWKDKSKTECGLHENYFKIELAAKKKVSPQFRCVNRRRPLLIVLFFE